MININAQIEALQNAVAALNAKVEELDSSILSTGDDAVSGLREKLQSAVQILENDIKELQSNAKNANSHKKW